LTKVPNVDAKEESVAIGGDNSGLLVNAPGSTFNLNFPAVASRLPSILADLIATFAEKSLAEYDVGARREIPPEALQKIAYNNFPRDHPILADYRQYSLLLERCYHGVEQQNADAHRLVRRKCAFAYSEALEAGSTAAKVAPDNRREFAINNASQLVNVVTEKLIMEYTNTKVQGHPYVEVVHLATSLVVADAIIECDVLERPV
jgi:hypothetical protein